MNGSRTLRNFVPLVALIRARSLGRGWRRASGCAWLALIAAGCTPVGDVNRRGEQSAGVSGANATGSSALAADGGIPVASSSAGRRAASAAVGGGTSGSRGPLGRGGAGAQRMDGAQGVDAGPGPDEPAARAAGSWYCMQVGASCTCVQAGGVAADTCSKPKPTCCFELVRFGANACTCWPADSAECKTQMTDVPDAQRTPSCPPS